MKTPRWIAYEIITVFLIVFLVACGSKAPEVAAKTNSTYEYQLVTYGGLENVKFNATSVRGGDSYGGHFIRYNCEGSDIDSILIQNGTVFISHKDGSVETFCGNSYVRRIK